MINVEFQALAPHVAELLPIPMKNIVQARIDLSVDNSKKAGMELVDRDQLWAYVAAQRGRSPHGVVWGGYLEHRSIYYSSALFQEVQHPRDIHLGLDFWADAGTAVCAPLAGQVHSFQDNAAFKDYGPTIVLQHEVHGLVFYSLYGHLARKSLDGLAVGMQIAKGQLLGWLGEEFENGQWPPHLHFQLVRDMQGLVGDYPGVCASQDLDFYRTNCPNPSDLLGL
jgi:peptidoglycan LD-endopeptidase LytH